MFHFVIVSDYPALVCCEDKRLLLDRSKVLKLNSEIDKTLTLEIFPTKPVLEHHRLIPYCVTLKKENGLISAPERLVDFIRFSPSDYLIRLNEFYVSSQSDLLHQEAPTGAKITVNTDGEILVQSDGTVAFHKTLFRVLIKAELVTLPQNYFAVIVSDAQEEGTVFVFDENNKIVLEQKADKVEQTDEGFQTLRVFHDIVQNGLVGKYKIDNGISLVSNESVYLRDKPKSGYPDSVIPIVFLQCIKAKNFTLAKSLLTLGLQERVSEESLANYFGDYDFITTDSPMPCNENEFSLVYGKENRVAKNYRFTIQNNLICDINS